MFPIGVPSLLLYEFYNLFNYIKLLKLLKLKNIKNTVVTWFIFRTMQTNTVSSYIKIKIILLNNYCIIIYKMKNIQLNQSNKELMSTSVFYELINVV